MDGFYEPVERIAFVFCPFLLSHIALCGMILLSIFAVAREVSKNRIRLRLFTGVHAGSRCASLAVSRVVLCCFFRGVSSVLLHGCYMGHTGFR